MSDEVGLCKSLAGPNGGRSAPSSSRRWQLELECYQVLSHLVKYDDQEDSRPETTKHVMLDVISHARHLRQGYAEMTAERLWKWAQEATRASKSRLVNASASVCLLTPQTPPFLEYLDIRYDEHVPSCLR